MHNDRVRPPGVEVAGQSPVRRRVALLIGRVAGADLECAPELVAFGSGFDQGQDIVFLTEIQMANRAL